MNAPLASPRAFKAPEPALSPWKQLTGHQWLVLLGGVVGLGL